jgi:hypothetical protein
MGNPIVSSDFTRLLDDVLTEVAESSAKFMDLKSMIPSLFMEASSDKAWEEFFEVGGVPDIQEFTGTIPYLAVAPGFHKKIEHREYAGGLQIERKLLDDKRYSVLEERTSGLMESAYRVREKKAARAWQYAFSTSFDFMTSEEGVAWCSNSHTTKSGVSTSSGFDNLNTTALSKTAVAAARLAMRRFKTDIGERFEVSDDLWLIVPDNLADTAEEIAGTIKGLDTGDGNINPQYGRYRVIPYLRLDDVDTNNWFMVDGQRLKKELIFYDRIKPEYKTDVDFDTYRGLQAVYMRISYGWKDWRSVLGSQVS